MSTKRRWLRVLVVLTLLFAAGFGSVAVFAYVRGPDLVAELGDSGALPFSPQGLTPARLCALLAVQDRTFFSHQGIGVMDGPPGHTTLTQAVCKGLFFNGFRPGLLRHRKVLLMVLAWGFDRSVPKEMQIRVFLNRTYFGNDGDSEILGFPAAARTYFEKDLQTLTDEEYAALLAMLDAPNTFHAVRNPEENAARVAVRVDPAVIACGPECLKTPPFAPCAAKVR